MALGIYARVSTLAQTDNTSVQKQVEMCKERAFEMGYFDSNIRLYIDEGRSGEDIDTRPELTKLREDVANGLISRVICVHPDRLSRDLTDKLIVCREFEKNGAILSFTDTEFKNSPEGMLFFNIISAIASYELSLIKKRTIRGRLEKVKKDKQIMPMRTAPFGYDKASKGKLSINKTEKEYVQMIYEWYVYERLTMREIGERLYKLGVKPKRGESSNWSASSIRRVLTNEIYIGKYYYNRRETKKVRGELTKSGNPKKTYTFRPEEDWLDIDVDAIIDKQLWELAQQQRQKNDKNKHVGNKKFEYLLKSIIKCGHCGRMYQATTNTGGIINKETGERQRYRCYRCPNKNPKKYGPEVKKCDVPTVRAELLEDFIWNQVIEMITNPEDFLKKINGQKNDSIEDVQDKVELFYKELKKKESALEKVELALFETDSDYDINRYKNYAENYKREIDGLKVEIEKYEQQIKAYRVEELSNEQIYNMVKRLKERLNSKSELDFEIKRNIIEMMFDEIIIKFNTANEMVVTSIGLFDKLQQNNDGLCSQRQEV